MPHHLLAARAPLPSRPLPLPGYTASLTAASHPDLVSGLVLFNSAGRLSAPSSPQPSTEPIKLIPDGYQPDDASPSSTSTAAGNSAQVPLAPLPLPAPVSPASSGPPLFFARLIAKLLLLYLRTSAPAQLKRCYPKVRAAARLLVAAVRGDFFAPCCWQWSCCCTCAPVVLSRGDSGCLFPRW